MCLIHEKSWEHIVQKCDFSPKTATVLCVYTRQYLLAEHKEYKKLEKMVSGYHLNKAFIYFMLLFHSRLRGEQIIPESARLPFAVPFSVTIQ